MVSQMQMMSALILSNPVTELAPNEHQQTQKVILHERRNPVYLSAIMHDQKQTTPGIPKLQMLQNYDREIYSTDAMRVKQK
jgi:hypothetical protein